ncbi:MAG: hypothetical protein GXO60_03225 [Epsilonproteobacteria bacterium]|nr:hypothetical protein [Campylobacterota bacterium]
MLQYKRRNSKDAFVKSQESNFSPLLTYCNWSYAPDYHIDLETLKEILRSFNQKYIPYYLRIFNETPSKVVKAFLGEYGISKSSLESISNNLLDNGFKVKNVNL